MLLFFLPHTPTWQSDKARMNDIYWNIINDKETWEYFIPFKEHRVLSIEGSPDRPFTNFYCLQACRYGGPVSCTALVVVVPALPLGRGSCESAAWWFFPTIDGSEIRPTTWDVNKEALNRYHHQDYYIFSRGSQPKPSFATGILGGGTTQGINCFAGFIPSIGISIPTSTRIGWGVGNANPCSSTMIESVASSKSRVLLKGKLHGILWDFVDSRIPPLWTFQKLHYLRWLKGLWTWWFPVHWMLWREQQVSLLQF